jgi:hypothetical protein
MLQPVSLLLATILVASSCSTHKQVACPPYQEYKYLAKKSHRVKYKTHKRTKYSYAHRMKTHRNKNVIRRNTVVQPGYESTEIRPVEVPASVSAVFGSVECRRPRGNSLMASANTKVSGWHDEALTGIMGKSLVNDHIPADTEVREMTGKEERKFKRQFRKEIRKMFQDSIDTEESISSGHEKTTRGMAIASMVLGISSILILPIIPAVLAIIFGTIALRRIRNNPHQPGRGMAIAGIICGIAGIISFLTLILLVSLLLA